MTDPDSDKVPPKPVKPVTPVSDETASAMEVSTPLPRPIRFPKLRTRGKTFIDHEFHMIWDYLTAGFFRS